MYPPAFHAAGGACRDRIRRELCSDRIRSRVRVQIGDFGSGRSLVSENGTASSRSNAFKDIGKVISEEGFDNTAATSKASAPPALCPPITRLKDSMEERDILGKMDGEEATIPFTSWMFRSWLFFPPKRENS